MHIKILGSGCKKCLALEKNVKAAIDAAGITVDIEKVNDIVDIAGYGVMSTPSLVIDDAVVSTGKILNVAQVAELLTQRNST